MVDVKLMDTPEGTQKLGIPLCQKAWLRARFLGFLSTEGWIHSLYLLRKIPQPLALEDRVLEVSQPICIYLVGSQFIQVVRKDPGTNFD